MSQSLIKPGVVTGEALNQLLRHANENNYAL
ncbi:MAG: fructose-bisphosphate aldolase class II, partial [Arcticibacterium sp.]